MDAGGGDGEGEAGEEGQDALEFPAGGEEAGDAAGAREIRLALAEGKLVAGAGDVAVTLVVARAAAVQALVAGVAGLVGLDLAGVVVDDLGPGVVGQKVQAARVGLLYPDGAAVVVAVGIVGGGENAGVELGEGDALDDGDAAGGVEGGLVLVVALPELVEVGAGVADLDQPVIGELALDVEVIFERVRGAVVAHHREGGGEAEDLVEAGEEVVDEDVGGAGVAHQGEDAVEGGDQAGELELV